jgi:hypothetical protein
MPEPAGFNRAIRKFCEAAPASPHHSRPFPGERRLPRHSALTEREAANPLTASLTIAPALPKALFAIASASSFDSPALFSACW